MGWEERKREREIDYRNWLKWLWRLKSVMPCSLQAGDLEKLGYNSVQGQRPENQECWCPKAGEDGCLSSSRVNVSFLHLSVLLGPLRDGMMPPSHWLGLSSLLSLPIQMLVSSRNTLQTHAEMMFYLLPGHPLAQPSWRQINHYHRWVLSLSIWLL